MLVEDGARLHGCADALESDLLAHLNVPILIDMYHTSYTIRFVSCLFPTTRAWHELDGTCRVQV